MRHDIMQAIQKALLVARTLRYLRPIQIWGQLRNRLPRKLPVQPEEWAVAVPDCEWQIATPKHRGYEGSSTFRFLNVKSEISLQGLWWESKNGNLWNYNLNYFEWLNQGEKLISGQEASQLISQWIDSNPPGSSRAWDSYPVSLRIINWIRFFLENGACEGAHESLAYQARWLSSRLEIHLLGNHYLLNGVALIFSGLYFTGEDANEWLRVGWEIVRDELDAEVLEDGGHFERSPMYHSLILEDVLNLLNLSNTFLDRAPEGMKQLCEQKASSMLLWLRKMTCKDDSFPLFNDSAEGIAASCGDLLAYAEKLSIKVLGFKSVRGIEYLPDSGFARIENKDALIFAEIGGPGPSHQPGHAHAGTLGFELMLKEHRVLVDTGTNSYDVGAKRDYLRSTQAHNTLVVEGQSSSEAWSSFRLGRRAIGNCLHFERDKTAPVQTLSAQHDGYVRLGLGGVHQRTWALSDDSLKITDVIRDLEGKKRVAIRFHFHPEVEVFRRDGAWIAECDQLQIRVTEQEGFQYFLDSYEYLSQFGFSTSGKCLVARATTIEVDVTHELRWSDSPTLI